MKNNSIDKKEIERLLPHREPMLLVDRLINIVPLKSAVAIVNVKKTSFFVQGHFPGQPVMPGVFIVEAFGQAAAALTAHSVDPKEYKNNYMPALLKLAPKEYTDKELLTDLDNALNFYKLKANIQS